MISFSYNMITCPAGPERREKTQVIISQLKLTHEQILSDIRRQGLWFNAYRAWKAHDPSKKYHLVLQDDVLLCKNFLKNVERIITQTNFDLPIIQLYHNKVTATDLKCEGKGLHWIISPLVTTAQALMIRTDLIVPWLRWTDRNVNRAYKFDDGRLMMWQALEVIPAFFTFPNIVDHDDSLPSSIGLPRGKRVSYAFENDPKRIDWTLNTDNLVKHSKSIDPIKDEFLKYKLN